MGQSQPFRLTRSAKRSNVFATCTVIVRAAFDLRDMADFAHPGAASRKRVVADRERFAQDLVPATNFAEHPPGRIEKQCWTLSMLFESRATKHTLCSCQEFLFRENEPSFDTSRC